MQINEHFLHNILLLIILTKIFLNKNSPELFWSNYQPLYYVEQLGAN